MLTAKLNLAGTLVSHATTNKKKEILIICDSLSLARLLQWSLQSYGHITQRLLNTVTPLRKRSLDLIVLALSSSANEPVVALTRLAAGRWLGRVPLIIISDRPFESAPQENILHMNFPFDTERLGQTVESILQ